MMERKLARRRKRKSDAAGSVDGDVWIILQLTNAFFFFALMSLLGYQKDGRIPNSKFNCLFDSIAALDYSNTALAQWQ